MNIEEIQEKASECLSCKAKPCRKRLPTNKRYNRIYKVHKNKRI